MRCKAVVVACTLLGLIVTSPAFAQTRGNALENIDVKKIQRFCDTGFRWVKTGIEFDLEKVLGLGLKVDTKILQAVSSQASVQIAALTQTCRFAAAGFISSQQFIEMTQRILDYAKDLESTRALGEKEAGVPVTKKPDPRLDAADVAKIELGLTINPSTDLAGDFGKALAALASRYVCTCVGERRE